MTKKKKLFTDSCCFYSLKSQRYITFVGKSVDLTYIIISLFFGFTYHGTGKYSMNSNENSSGE
jgi:hypothetical protein